MANGNVHIGNSHLTFSYSTFSPIHDHAGSHCVMKILDGELKESLFDWPDMNDQENVDAAADACDITTARKADVCPKTGVCLTKQRETIYGADQVTYVHGMQMSNYSVLISVDEKFSGTDVLLVV